MKIYAFRINPEKEIKKSIIDFVNQKHIKAGAIVTCVGSLSRATLRMADENVVKSFEKKFEIVSLVGTLSLNGCHLHISLADKEGNTIGGHLKEGIIHTTAEIVILEITNTKFSREYDDTTKFKELVVAVCD